MAGNPSGFYCSGGSLLGPGCYQVAGRPFPRRLGLVSDVLHISAALAQKSRLRAMKILEAA